MSWENAKERKENTLDPEIGLSIELLAEVKEAKSLRGLKVYLKGTRNKTKVSGYIEEVEIIKGRLIKDGIHIIYHILWDGQSKTMKTKRIGFDIS